MVEKWLLQVQLTMISSLKDVMMKSVTAYEVVPRGKWVLEWPGQVIIAASTVYWTADVTKAIEEGTLKVRIVHMVQTQVHRDSKSVSTLVSPKFCV